MPKKMITLFISLICTILYSLNVFAAESISIVKSAIANGKISAYINAEVDDCSATLGSVPCEVVSYTGARDIPSDTLILIDNSGSIPQELREKTSEFLSELIEGKIENERYAIASLGTDMTYLCDFTSDRYELSKAAEKLEYKEKSSYIYSVLDKAINDLNNDVFSKIIIISDGRENSSDGITYDEILKTASDAHCPIYTLGFESDSRESLKRLHSFARSSAAQSFTLTSDTDVSEVCSALNECRDYTCITVKIPEGQADGSIKYLNLSGENFECGIDIRMPVAKIVETEITETTAETTSETAAEYAEVGKTAVLNKKIIIGIAAIAVFVLAAVIVIFRLTDRKKKLPEKSESPIDQGDIETKFKKHGSEDTVIDDCMIMLTDVNAPEHSFRCALGNGVIIGRSAKECMIAIDYDGYVSRRHCRIYREKNKIFIENLSGKQEVTINGKCVLEKAGDSEKSFGGESTGTKILIPNVNSSVGELSSGDLIRIGHTTLRFEIK